MSDLLPISQHGPVPSLDAIREALVAQTTQAADRFAQARFLESLFRDFRLSPFEAVAVHVQSRGTTVSLSVPALGLGTGAMTPDRLASALHALADRLAPLPIGDRADQSDPVHVCSIVEPGDDAPLFVEVRAPSPHIAGLAILAVRGEMPDSVLSPVAEGAARLDSALVRALEHLEDADAQIHAHMPAARAVVRLACAASHAASLRLATDPSPSEEIEIRLPCAPESPISVSFPDCTHPSAHESLCLAAMADDIRHDMAGLRTAAALPAEVHALHLDLIVSVVGAPLVTVHAGTSRPPETLICDTPEGFSHGAPRALALHLAGLSRSERRPGPFAIRIQRPVAAPIDASGEDLDDALTAHFLLGDTSHDPYTRASALRTEIALSAHADPDSPLLLQRHAGADLLAHLMRVDPDIVDLTTETPDFASS